MRWGSSFRATLQTGDTVTLPLAERGTLLGKKL